MFVRQQWVRRSLFVLCLLFQCGAAAAQLPKPASAAKPGRQIFEENCSFCHGADASGGSEGPSLIHSALVRHDENGNLIAPVIRNGRPEKGMPSFSLSEQQIAEVVAFLHAQVTASDNASARRPSKNYARKLLLTGNAAAGKAYFFSAGGCSHCHSPTGDLAHIAKKYAPVDLQTRFLYPSGAKKTATITLSSGKRVSGTLAYLDAFTVAIRGSGGWYRSWPRDSVKVAIHDPLAAHRALLHKYTQADIHNLFAYLETLQ
jgi:cytochrome c oxidase cbb3-type subunit 3